MILEGALDFREHSSGLSGAYLCKSKTAENEFKSDAQKVRFDTFQALNQYLPCDISASFCDGLSGR